jgi:hypothetical protein
MKKVVFVMKMAVAMSVEHLKTDSRRPYSVGDAVGAPSRNRVRNLEISNPPPPPLELQYLQHPLELKYLLHPRLSL